MSGTDQYLRTDEHGITRCWWCEGDASYIEYHDTEWGVPVDDDVRLFEKICLEGFQAGLSWLTILRKRENFREAFCNFDFIAIARFNSKSVDRLLKNAGIIRHRGKIESTINNARRALELVDEFGSLGAFFWQFEPDRKGPTKECPSVTVESTALSKELKRRGWSFVGPTTAYAFMQAMGMVNDHIDGCSIRDEIEKRREEFVRPK